MLPMGLLLLPKAVASVFAPAPSPPDFTRATRVPLVFHPLTFLHNAQDVVRAWDAVNALSPHYGKIRIPTEIVVGECDTTILPSVHGERCARDIPDARLTKLPNVGHAAHHIAPDRIVECLVNADARSHGKLALGGVPHVP